MRVHLNKIIVGVTVISVFFIVFIIVQKNTNENPAQSFEVFQDIDEDKEKQNLNKIDEQIIVDIKGEIVHEGIYEMTEQDRVNDVIVKAGGFTDEAALDYVNLAERVYDAMVIRIPSEQEVESLDFADLVNMAEDSTSNESQETTVDLNSAMETELQTLPGIGPSKADAIIAYREENGPFETEEDIMEVSGIGAKTFEALKEFIRVR